MNFRSSFVVLCFALATGAVGASYVGVAGTAAQPLLLSAGLLISLLHTANSNKGD